MSASAEITHACPHGDSNVTACCSKTPFELPSTDRLTLDDSLVNCPYWAYPEPRK